MDDDDSGEDEDNDENYFEYYRKFDYNYDE